MREKVPAMARARSTAIALDAPEQVAPASFLRRGLTTGIGVGSAAVVEATLSAAPRGLGGRRLHVAGVRTQADGPGEVVVTLHPNRRARLLLGLAGEVDALLRVRAVDRDGNAATRSRLIALR